MTDRGLFLWVLGLCLSASAAINVLLILSLARPLRDALRAGLNGPRTAILRGTLRRRVLSLVLHGGLLVTTWARVLGHPVPPAAAAIVLLMMIAGLMVETGSDMFDFRLLRGLLKSERHE